MTPTPVEYVLGSRSPQRLNLLKQLVPEKTITVCPPLNSDELGFGDAIDSQKIENRLLENARGKCEDVMRQRRDDPSQSVVITADTVIVARDQNDRPVVLGQPAGDDTIWKETVRRWFREFLAGKTHIAMTAVCVAGFNGPQIERIAKTCVTFHEENIELLEWYLATGEPRGKAGGYAIQGKGSLFVSRVEGSLSNVIGLPLEVLREMFLEIGIERDHNKKL